MGRSAAVCASRCVVSCRVVSCRVVSCRVVSCRVVSCRVASCRVVWCDDSGATSAYVWFDAQRKPVKLRP